MICPKCGPAPDDVIFDGVTLAFGKKHLLPTLRPPTVKHGDSLTRRSRYVRGQSLLADIKLRRHVRGIVKGEFAVVGITGETPGSLAEEDEEDEEEEIPQPPTDIERLRRECLQVIANVAAQLQRVNVGLGELFQINFGIPALRKSFKAPQVYVKFFKQVCRE